MKKNSRKSAAPKAKGRKATYEDARILMQLYDFRREAEMRKARAFLAQFNPSSFDDFMRIVGAFGTPENNHFRQCISYWEMVASLALHDVVPRDLFNAWCGEMYFVWVKVQPFVAQFRSTANPNFLKNVEALAEGTPEGRERCDIMRNMIKRFAERAESGAERRTA